MQSAFLSPDWYRVEFLKLRRRSNVQVVRHAYRNQPWFIIQDLQAGKFHRLSPQSFSIFSRMNGEKTVHQLWEIACRQFPDAPPSQTEIIQLLSQLHNADLVIGDKRPNMTEINRRAAEENRKTTLGYFKNPLSVRLPLFDPEPILKKCIPLACLIFSPIGGIVFLLILLAAALVAMMSWQHLEAPRVETILSANNIAYLAISYVFVKAVHELGHGFAIKRYGGEVREFGIMMLVFFPVPYVDASHSTFFTSKYQRIVVSIAGVAVELSIAALALIVWALSDEGVLSTLAYNLFLIGGISTLLFNGNPLLRFDGYFAFADLIESPNLGQRSNQYFWYLFQKFILGHKEAYRPVTGIREEKWLFGYSVAAFLYRVFVMILISLYIASAIPILGVILVLWSLYMVFLAPMVKGVKFLMTDSRLDTIRGKSLFRLLIVFSAGALLFFWVPFPHSTTMGAVLDGPSGSQVRINGNGFANEILVGNGQQVQVGQELLRLSDPLLQDELSLAMADLEDALLRLAIVPLSDVNARSAWLEQTEFFEARLSELLQRERDLTARAPASGIFAFPDEDRLLGRFLQQGEIVGYILHTENRVWRAAAPADRATFIDTEAASVTIRIETIADGIFPAHITSRSPEVTTRLASFALTNRAGGHLVIDPQFDEPTSIMPVVNYTLAIADHHEVGVLPHGTRAIIRIVHEPKPMAPRVMRAIRRTFLMYFGS